MIGTAYLFQALLVAAWWLGLGLSKEFYAAFQFPEFSDAAFNSFLVPDLILIGGLSVARAYHINWHLQLIILGAFAYATLYCLNASILTGGGYLSTTLMVFGLAYNVFLCFHKSFFRTSFTQGLLPNGIKTALQIVVTWALTLVVFPMMIVTAFGQSIVPDVQASPYAIHLILASVLFAACGVLGIVSSYFMVKFGDGTPLPIDQAKNLVTVGPYQYVRNPMAIAGIGQGIAVSLIYLSWPIFGYAMLGAVVWHFAVRPIEEEDLIARFGDCYRQYRANVKCWIPRLGNTSIASKKV